MKHLPFCDYVSLINDAFIKGSHDVNDDDDDAQ